MEKDKTAADKMDDLIRKAEAKSEVTCETCGKEGMLRSYGWWKVLCDECEEKSTRRK